MEKIIKRESKSSHYRNLLLDILRWSLKGLKGSENYKIWHKIAFLRSFDLQGANSFIQSKLPKENSFIGIHQFKIKNIYKVPIE